MADNTISNAVNNANQSNSSTYNPNSILDKDDFMKLFLTELQYQDPTSPMDTDKMIDQTASLTTVESMQNMTKSIDQLVGSFQSVSYLNTLSTIGQLANTGLNGIKVTEGATVDLKEAIYIPHDFDNAKIIVKNSSGDKVQELQFGSDPNNPILSGKAGLQPFEWDGRDKDGNKVDVGQYTFEASYVADNKQYTVPMGFYPIESIKIDGAEAQVKVYGSYVGFSSISEVVDPQAASTIATLEKELNTDSSDESGNNNENSENSDESAS